MTWRQPEYNFKLIIDGYTEHDIDEPQGFRELESLIYRDLRVHGCFYEMTPADFPLAFDGIAKDILRNAFDEDGVDSEANINFLVEKTILDTAEFDTPTTIESEIISGTGTGWNLLVDQSGEGKGQSFVIPTFAYIKNWSLRLGTVSADAGTFSIVMYSIDSAIDGSSVTELYRQDGITHGELTANDYNDFEINKYVSAGNILLAFIATGGAAWGVNVKEHHADYYLDGEYYTTLDSGSSWTSAASEYDLTSILSYDSISGLQSIIIGDQDWEQPITTEFVLGQTYTFDKWVTIYSWAHYLDANVGSPTYNVYGRIYKVESDGLPSSGYIVQTAALTPTENGYITATFDQILPPGEYAMCLYFDEISLDPSNYAQSAVNRYGRTYYGGYRVIDSNANGSWTSLEASGHTLVSDLIYLEEYGKTTEFSGNIDFSNAREDDKYFYCSVLRSDLLVDVLNNRDMEVQLNDTLDVFGNPAISNALKTVSMHSFKIRKKWESTKRSEGSYESETDTDDAYLMFGYDVIGTDEIDESQDITYQMKTVLTGDNTEAIWLADLVEGYVTISMNWDVELYHYIENTAVGSETFEHQIYLEALIYDSGDNLLDTMTFLTIEQSTGALDPGPPDNTSTLSGNYTGSGSFGYDSLADGDYIVVYWRYGTDNFANCSNEYRFQPNDWDLTIEIDTIEPASTTEGYLVFDAIEDCLRRITGLPYPLESDFFNFTGCGYLNILTNGWKIRKFDEPVTTSFSRLFRSLSTIFGLGYGVEQQNKVKIELWEHFYQDEELVDLGDVGDYEEQVMGEEIFNQIKLGFRYYANDEDLINSKEDFHTEAAWATPIRSHKGEFDQVSDIICSSFLIESVRRAQFSVKPTTSTRWDDHKFLISVDEGAGTSDYDAETDESIIVTGLTNGDSAYNLRHTIKRMILNWGVWINSFSMRYKEVTALLRNLYYRNNGAVTTQFNPDEGCLMGAPDNLEYQEDDDITKAEIQEGYAAFDQKTISFTKQLTDEELQKIRDGHDGAGDNYNTYNYGYLSCNDFDGNKVNGWLLECQYNIYSKLAKFKLLKRFIAGAASTGIAWDCLPATGTFGLRTITNNYYQVTQWISLPVGTLKKIYIDKTDSGSETIFIYIAQVRWTGHPYTGNKLYNTGHTINEGENEIDIDLAITTADCYAIGMIRISTDVDLRTVSQSGYTSLPCATDYVLPSQLNTTASDGNWNAPSTNELVKHKLNYLPTSINLKTLMICSNSIGFGNRIDSTSEMSAQQIEFKGNVTLHNVSFYVFKGGVPTKTLLCSVYEYDSTKDGNLGDHIATSYEATPGTDFETAFTFANTYSLDAGKYVFTIFAYILSAGTLDASNYYLPVYTLHADAYQPGLPLQFRDGTWTEYPDYRQIMKIRYEPN